MFVLFKRSIAQGKKEVKKGDTAKTQIQKIKKFSAANIVLGISAKRSQKELWLLWTQIHYIDSTTLEPYPEEEKASSEIK